MKSQRPQTFYPFKIYPFGRRLLDDVRSSLSISAQHPKDVRSGHFLSETEIPGFVPKRQISLNNID